MITEAHVLRTALQQLVDAVHSSDASAQREALELARDALVGLMPVPAAPSLIVTTSQPVEDAAINGRFVGRYRTSKRYGSFKSNLAARVEAMRGATLRGPCFVTIAPAFARTCREEHNAGLPLGDVDSPVKCILDALKLGGAYVDDSQVAGLLVSKWPRPEHTIVEVAPCAL
ncbi:MAG: RusA family crossover junction endodeoxyribonuclease [Deltaproteobacteria bacterium]|nr:RusA family crossover junction endodeoxyribonuclease [Deltaproteobacteria bacterium]